MSALVTSFGLLPHPRISEWLPNSIKFSVASDDLNGFLNALEAKAIDQRLPTVMEAHNNNDHFLHRMISDVRQEPKGIEKLTAAIPRLLYSLNQPECVPVLELRNSYNQSLFERAVDLNSPELMVGICTVIGDKDFKILAGQGGADIEMRLVHQMIDFKNKTFSSSDLLEYILREAVIKKHYVVRKPTTPVITPTVESPKPLQGIHLVN